MHCYLYLARFFGNAFLANGVPHFELPEVADKEVSDIRSIPEVLVWGAGGVLVAVMLARAFGRQ